MIVAFDEYRERSYWEESGQGFSSIGGIMICFVLSGGSGLKKVHFDPTFNYYLNLKKYSK
jgi:hypothetical protein